MKPEMMPYKMKCGRNLISPALLVILVTNVFRGQASTCHRTEYEIGTECCPMCPTGNRVKTDCTEFKSTSCLPCSEGTFMNEPTGLKHCFHCANCDTGSGLKINTSCTRTSDTVCEALEGFYCIDSTEEGCRAAQRHTSCRPGQYISQTGTAFSDTVCSDCSDGTYSNGTFTSCLPHTQCESMNLQLIKQGTVSADAECGKQSSLSTNIIISISIVVVTLFLLVAGIFVISWRRKKKASRNTGFITVGRENRDLSTQALKSQCSENLEQSTHLHLNFETDPT